MKALTILIISFVVSGCASDLVRYGVTATDFSSVYVGMPRLKFEELVDVPVDQSETQKNVIAIYEYDRGYIGCLDSGRCEELTPGAEAWGRASEVLFSIATLGILPWSEWERINECQTGYIAAQYGQSGTLVSIRVLPPEPYKVDEYHWEKDTRKPWLNNPCREIYYHPQASTIPEEVMINDVTSISPE